MQEHIADEKKRTIAECQSLTSATISTKTRAQLNSKGSHINAMSVIRHLFLSLALTLSSASHALDFSSISLLDKKPGFSIIVDGDEKLGKVLEKEITSQRKKNEQLQQYSKPRKIARLESQLLKERLRAEGYYDAQVRFVLKENIKEKAIRYQVLTGTVYRVETLSLDLPEDMTAAPVITGINTGQALRAEQVLTAVKYVRDFVAEHYCYYEINVDYRVILEEDGHKAHVTIAMHNSPQVNFGTITFKGLTSIDDDYLLARLPVKKGDCFKKTGIDAARLVLIQSNLLARVDIEAGQLSEGAVPLVVHAKERYHRTLSAGIGYQSDEGAGLTLGWEHRNLFGRAQRLQADTKLASEEQSIGLDFSIPHFLRDSQTMTLFSEYEREDTEAFDSRDFEIGAEIARQLNRQLRVVLGSSFSLSSVTEDNVQENFALVSLPVSLEYDRRNDPLDPRRGWAAATTWRPYWDTRSGSNRFDKTTLALSGYLSFDHLAWRPTLALRGAFGIIDGAGRESVPANVRFYVGGGGSVRGYPFQTLGPLTDNDPDGGLSFNEYSFETRVRWGQNWGAVAFLDGGFAYSEKSPQLGEDLLWGAGIGLRYYTSFAPIRLDVAVPLNKRDNIDDSFQLYISIGQAF